MSYDQIAVELTGINKKYRLFKSRRDRLLEALHPFNKTYHREYWALRDIDLALPKGRTIGILGVNGSGKSTLLQIICSVLRPTSGTCAVNGRVAALLELGAGFNLDLTGRENATTNALIMGLERRAVDSRINEIATFADVGEYFDQPVRTYSSGMFMRVAFATAIHVDPDILIIDEALAVGDAKFQEKCFQKFKEFQAAGKTILYVTHDRTSVTYLCDQAVLLHKGALVGAGDPHLVVDAYTELLTTGTLPNTLSATLRLTERGRIEREPVAAPRGVAASSAMPAPHDAVSSTKERAQKGGTSAMQSSLSVTEPVEPSWSRDDVIRQFVADDGHEDRFASNPLFNVNERRFGTGAARLIDVLIRDEKGTSNPGSLASGSMAEIFVKIHFPVPHARPLIGMTLTNSQGVAVFWTHSGWLGTRTGSADAGDVRVYRFTIRLALVVGAWFLELAVARAQDDLSDVRSSSIVLDIARTQMYMGLVDLSPQFDELAWEPEVAIAGHSVRDRVSGA